MYGKDHINKLDAAHRLAQIWRGWEEAAYGQDLDHVKCPVGLLLNDVEEATSFEPGEISEITSREVLVR